MTGYNLWECGCESWTEGDQFILKACDVQRPCAVQRAALEAARESGTPVRLETTTIPR